MLDLAGAVADVVGKLAAAGLRACDDQRDLNPPGVYVGPPSITFDRLQGWTASLDLYAVVPASGRHQALTALGPLVNAVVAVWPATVGYPLDLQALDSTDPLPAYRLPIHVRVTDQ